VATTASPSLLETEAWGAVDFLDTGDQYFHRLFAEISRAEKSVLLEYYIFQLDRLGRELLEVLSACQRKGVKVFLRVDGLGSRDNLQAIADFCGEAQIELEVFHPLPFEAPGAYFPVGFAKADTFLGRWKKINRRTHRKIAIVDERIAFTGGMNVKEYQAERFVGKKAWHDLSLRLEGPAVAELLHAFWFRPVKKNGFRHCLLNYSMKLRKERNEWISRSIRQSRARLWIVTPYFAPTPTMLFQLRLAARRGVDIRLVLSKKSDVLLSRLAAMGLYRKLMQWGIKVCEYEPSVLHRKLWIIDDLVLVGSTNLNHRSFIHDLELDVILRETKEVKRASELFEGDQAASTLVTLESLNDRSFYQRALSWLAGWFTYWL
jgi:cardiolipin synthase